MAQLNVHRSYPSPVLSPINSSTMVPAGTASPCPTEESGVVGEWSLLN
jgi:hypothetical protein